MALSAFEDPTRQPTRGELEATLGAAMPAWDALVGAVRELAGDVAETWKHSGRTFGWSMRLVAGTRVLVYLTPQAGQALVGAVLGERAIAAAEAAGAISPRSRVILDAAPRYAEGRGVRLPMTTQDDLAVAVELARIKLGR